MEHNPLERTSRPLVWAHRGASGYAPENTLAAFGLAAEMGADGVELDVQLTKDGKVVVCHDERVDRTSDGAGFIRDLTFEELRSLDFSCGNAAYEGERIPSLAEVLDLLEPTGLTVNIEVKTGIFFYPGLIEETLGTVREHGMCGRVVYSSFNHVSVMDIKKADPLAPTGLLYADGLVWPAAYGLRCGADALHPALYNLQYPGFMESAAEAGLAVNVWTVDLEEHLLLCRDAGVNAVITNYPEKALKLFS